MMECPYCGSHSVGCIGIDDGDGDYGNYVLDQYRCMRCDMQFSSNVYTYETITDDEGYECIMCGKPTARKAGKRCSDCEQLWSS